MQSVSGAALETTGLLRCNGVPKEPMTNPKSRFRTVSEYALIRAVLGLVRLIPTWLAFRLTDWIGDLAYLFDRQHRLVACKNLARVFGGSADDPEHRRSARMVFRHFMRVAAEFAVLPRLIERRGLDHLIHIQGRENVDSALASGKGVIIFGAHYGNWEVLSAVGRPLGLRLHSVGRTLDNPLLDRYVERERSRYVLSMIPKDGGLREIVRVLRSGHTVAMLLDQHAGRSGIQVDFLGRPASTFRAAAELSVRFGFPLLGGFGTRVDDAPRFELVFDPPLWPDPDKDRESEVRRLTQAASDAIAVRVRSHPEQWNWLHRRWRKKKHKKRKLAGQQESMA